MTEPTTEAVEAVARAIQDEAENSKQFEDAAWIEGFDMDMAKAAIVLIRDAIYSDGTDADAIREALGLEVELRKQHSYFDSPYAADCAWTIDRRPVGQWKESA